MKIHAFDIVPTPGAPSLVDILADIESTLLADRIRSGTGGDLRVNDIENHQSGWQFNLLRWMGGHGPGKAAPDTPLEGFPFEDDEGLVEDTAVFIPENKQVMLVQYNHVGPRASAISDYISNWLRNADYHFDLQPKCDPSVEGKWRDCQAIKKFTVKVAARQYTAEDRANNVSLGEVLGPASAAGGQDIEITISAGRGKREVLNNQAKGILNFFLDRARTHPGDVQKLTVGVKADIDSGTEVLDLLGKRLVWEEKIDLGPDKRYLLADRYRALRRCALLLP